MRLIELSFQDGEKVQPLLKATLKTEPLDHRLSEPDDRGRRLMRMVFQDGDGQKAVDAISAILEDDDDWRLVVVPVEASLPKVPDDDNEDRRRKRTVALREEIFQDIARGARTNSDFLLLTALSTIVVVFGLAADNVAAVIGAILAFSFGSALGDLELMVKAAKTALSGLFLGLALSFGVGLVFDLNLLSDELISRTVVGLDSTALALASGAAAALSIATGLPAALVGVMVAVALLPPAATAGLLAGAGEWDLSMRALLLLSINVVSVLLAALVVFFFKGIRPRTWLERRSAKRSVYVNAVVWVILIVGLSFAAARLTNVPGL